MSDVVKKVGIVIVSYNASEAVRITLASVRHARNRAAFKLILVDNASEYAEREKIRAAMELHIADIGHRWRYIQQERNLGFSGGNNIGISEFLSDEEITHICLLNSDVIVTDHWLDRLLDNQRDIISGVTNKADSEQCIPVDYHAAIHECFNSQSETLNDKLYRKISDFSDRWHEAWQGNIVESDVTFFCVLVSQTAIKIIGLLDETFFPGGFEDNDYCIRARESGYRIYLSRDTFIHHWGSASFGQLQYEYSSDRARRNKEYLENKHGITLQRCPEKPFISFAIDVAFALKRSDKIHLQRPFLELYLKNLATLLDHFEAEFRNLQNILNSSGRAIPGALMYKVATADAYGNMNTLWDSIAIRVRDISSSKSGMDNEDARIEEDLKRISSGIHDRVECNFAIHAFLTQRDEESSPIATTVPEPTVYPSAVPTRPTSRVGKFWWILRKGLHFLAGFDGIVFFGGYCYPERQGDGYFQRIQIVDRLFTDRWRVYVESDELRGRNVWFDRPEPKVLVLRIIGGSKRRWLVRMLTLLAVGRCRKIYYHSVLRMHDNRFGLLLHMPWIRKAVDIHGVVPEEFRMHNDYFSAVLYEQEERIAVENAAMVIVVTESMKQYLQQKFQDALKAMIVSFPMFPSVSPTVAPRPYVDGKPVVVYAGGLHKWQQVPKMIDAIMMTADRCSHRFYCPEPHLVKDMLPPALLEIVTIDSKPHSELMHLYTECHYGFILRENAIVNRVACPTKLVEYLAMGIVPIVDYEHIGDFKSLGMQFIRLEEFLAGWLPSEEQRSAMAIANLAVYERLKDIRQTGAREIYEYFTPGKHEARVQPSFIERVQLVLPPDTMTGRIARKAWRFIRTQQNGGTTISGYDTGSHQNGATITQKLSKRCDLLVQVENFEAGGLENVVIDLNRTLEAAGYSVALLVLGNFGSAAQCAMDLGMTVITHSYSDASYTELLDQVQPKIVIAHYSIKGVSICKQLSIPFVQVIHNTYMWFDEAQHREFVNAAADTTVFVAVSEYVRSYSVSRLAVNHDRVVVIPNGIDFRPFETMDFTAARQRLRALHGIGENEFVFLDVGAINHQKNHLATLKAFNLAQQSGTAMHLIILGPAYEQGLLHELEAYICAHGIGDKVTYCGAVQGAHEYFAMADAFVTGTFFEGASLTLLEAIRANLPVVMPNVGTAIDWKGLSGFEIVEPVFDINHYHGTILEMRSTPEFEHCLADAMLRTCRDPVRPGFTAEQLAALENVQTYAKYRTLVADILSEKRVHVGEPVEA